MENGCSICKGGNDCYECNWCEERIKIKKQVKNRIERAEVLATTKREKKEREKENNVEKPDIIKEQNMKENEVITKTDNNGGGNNNGEKKAPTNRIGNLINKFLGVTYTLEDVDMLADKSNKKELEGELINNFMKLTNLSIKCIGWMYVIEYTIGGTPHLHGMIRYDVSDKKERISVADPRFKHKNRLSYLHYSESQRGEKISMLLKIKNVLTWVEYLEKEGEGIRYGDIMDGIFI